MVGHELVHIAQSHFDEDAHHLLVLSPIAPWDQVLPVFPARFAASETAFGAGA